MTLLTKQELIDAPDIVTEEVYVPQWGGSVLVRTMTELQRGKILAALYEQRANGQVLRLQELQLRFCGCSIVDESGKRMFSDQELAILGKKSAAAIQVIFEVVARLNGLSNEQVEELSKNSDETPSDDSPSD